MLKQIWVPALFLLPALLPGCGKNVQTADIPSSSRAPDEASPFDPMSLQLETQELLEGRMIWMNTCADCHLEGLGGAPIIANKEEWADRILKGLEPLYTHALEGYWGDIGEMPAKGGNEALTDEQVKRAVDFVIHASK